MGTERGSCGWVLGTRCGRGCTVCHVVSGSAVTVEEWLSLLITALKSLFTESMPDS